MELYELLNSTNYLPRVDEWMPRKEDEIFKECKNAIIMPVTSFFYNGREDAIPELNRKQLDMFVLTTKRCYNSNEVRSHICLYLNYFEKYYDKEHELQYFMYKMKAAMHYGNNGNPYTLGDFYYDIRNHILSDSMYDKVWRMVEDNYNLDLSYKNKNNEGLQYSNHHGKYFMEMCIFMNILIPLLMHYVYCLKIMNPENINDIIYTVYNWLFEMYVDEQRMAKRGLKRADMFAKLYETASTTMESHYKANKKLWVMSEIRGFSPSINTNDSVNTIIMQVIPKYTFNGNVITYNISSVRNNPKFNISDISYEYDFSSLSSSKRDGEDNTSQFDKFEAHLTKIDEGLLLQNEFRANEVMKQIINKYGPFDQKEIDFYRNALISHGRPLVNAFQQKLVNDQFFRFFGDTMSINSINADQYIILIIATKRMLLADGMKLLPYILAGNVVQISNRTSLSKKEEEKVRKSEYWAEIALKYNGDEKKLKEVLKLIGTIQGSKFNIIDYYNPEINGLNIKIELDILMDEILRFIIPI